jgi:N-acetylmuramoyl-L-alanine amidase
MATYKKPASKGKKKKYQLQDPKKFLTFIGMVVLVILLLSLLLRSCGGKEDKKDNSSTVAQNSSAQESSKEDSEVNVLGDIQKQNVAWTAGLVNMTQGISTVQEEEQVQVPKIFTVVIDPGCGGNDSGNPGKGNIMEKTINLQVGVKLKEMLEEKYPEIRVVMTRTGDTGLTTSERVDIINNANADLVISLHCDYFAGSSERRGVSTYYRQAPEKVGEESSKGSGMNMSLYDMSKHIAEALQKKAVEALETEDRGTEAERYEIINATNAPTVLMEMVYLTDQSDYSKITNSEYQLALAEALADGIREELDTLYPTREQDVQNLNNSTVQ